MPKAAQRMGETGTRAAAETTFPRGSPVSQDLGSSAGQQRSPGMRSTWVPWVPDFPMKILAHVTCQANPKLCRHSSPALHPVQSRRVTVRRNFTAGTQPGAGKWFLAHRLCRSRTARGQSGGKNYTFSALCGLTDTRSILEVYQECYQILIYVCV